jgi:hypothetical protein
MDTDRFCTIKPAYDLTETGPETERKTELYKSVLYIRLALQNKTFSNEDLIYRMKMEWYLFVSD